MEDEDDVVYQGEVFKLSEAKKRLIGSKAGAWKTRYLIFRIKNEKPTLEYHKKKPKKNKKHDRTLIGSVVLWPCYKVEKIKNAKGRAFVCEITSTEHHIFLSVNEEIELDVLVFLLQAQIRLKSNIRDDLISVWPINSECHQKIGAANCKCVLHASPWGLTLALEKTRALLAQWPLKSIRYYEVPSPGHFNIEAGRVAPMGEGLFQFKTERGDEDMMYDLVDSYIVNTLDRVKPTQKGTPEEIEDYIREHDFLHSLTTISVCSRLEPEIHSILITNWNMHSSSFGDRESHQRNETESRESAQTTSASQPSQLSSLVINLNRPGDTAIDESRVTERPPAPPTRPINGGKPRRSRRREHSLPRKADVNYNLSDATDSTKTFNQHHHTEFYNLSSPNMKVRKGNSPAISKNVNKVGRAEYLLSQQQSGVKSGSESLSPDILHPHGESPASVSSFMGADHRTLDHQGQSVSQTHSGQLNRPVGSLTKDVSGSKLSVTSGASSYYTASGYVNLKDDRAGREVHHHRQISAPDMSPVSPVPQCNWYSSKDNVSSDLTTAPVVRHIRQRSADEISHMSADSISRKHIDSGIYIRPDSETIQRILEGDERLDKVNGGISTSELVDATVSEWLMSASCEDLSDHMRMAIYEDNHNGESSLVHNGPKQEMMNEGDSSLTLSSTGSSVCNDKPPLPFTGLKKFYVNTDVSSSRDRSRSFGYMNIPGSTTPITASPKAQSSAPSAHLIRKMVNVRAKQETLRKSLSNPNFLNLGSKEHLCTLKASSNSSKLDSEVKQKSKSFSSLFPAIKKAFSRESLGHSRSTTPERRNSRNSTPERRSSFSFKRRSSDSESEFKRQNSFHGIGEMTIKGIRMTERSRSFRKVRGAKSVEGLSRVQDEPDISRLSAASSPATNSVREVNRQSASSRLSDVRKVSDGHRPSEVSRDRQSGSSGQTVSNPAYITTAHIDLASLVTDNPPPIPARVRLESHHSINQVIRTPHTSSSKPGFAGYFNINSDTPNTDPSPDNERRDSQTGSSCLNQVVTLTKAPSESPESNYFNSSKHKETRDECPKKLEAHTLYENAADNTEPSKNLEVTIHKPRRALVSDMVAQMEKNSGSVESKKVFEKSPKLFHRNVPPIENNTTTMVDSRTLTLENRVDPAQGLDSLLASTCPGRSPEKSSSISKVYVRGSDGMVNGQLLSTPATLTIGEGRRVSSNSHKTGWTAGEQASKQSQASHESSSTFPKPFQPIPFRRQEVNGIRPVKAPAVVKPNS